MNEEQTSKKSGRNKGKNSPSPAATRPAAESTHTERKAAGKSGSLRLHKAAHDPRAAALVALARVLNEGADSQAALDDVLTSPELVPTDKRLCTELVYGVLRWYLRLDWFAGRFLTRPDKLPGEMRLCLLCALYEMAFLRVPHHAPVNWAVSHVRNRFGQGIAGVANGVLRSMQRGLKDFSDPKALAEHCAGPEEALAREYAMPAWIVRLWREHYGPEPALDLLKAIQAAPPSGLRLNRSRSGWEAARKELLNEAGEDGATAVGAAALAFSGALSWRARELVQQGMASRQSAASYEALEYFAPPCWPKPIWDCCAGRGGKTLALLEQGIPVALASDSSERRLEGFAREWERLGLGAARPPVLVLAADKTAASLSGGLAGDAGAETASLLENVPESFGSVLLDAPCSGLGTLSRRPEIRLRRTPEDVAALTRLQRRILDAVWQRLQPGGFLVYLTCTLNPAENEGQISEFFASHVDALLRREFQTPFHSPLREFFYGALLEKR